MNDETEYEFYQKLHKKAKSDLDRLDYMIDEHKPLAIIYQRLITIYEEIIQDLGPQLDDPQYCGTVSWNYEKEIKELNEKEETLKEIYEKAVEAQEYQSFLQDMGMTHEQWQEFQQNELKEKQAKCNKRLKK